MVRIVNFAQLVLFLGECEFIFESRRGSYDSWEVQEKCRFARDSEFSISKQLAEFVDGLFFEDKCLHSNVVSRSHKSSYVFIIMFDEEEVVFAREWVALTDAEQDTRNEVLADLHTVLLVIISAGRVSALECFFILRAESLVVYDFEGKYARFVVNDEFDVNPVSVSAKCSRDQVSNTAHPIDSVQCDSATKSVCTGVSGIVNSSRAVYSE